ncbi:acetylglutamate kinase [Aspergillus eucalypticola CBS 122712]|uniref:acetylglutamate kinase n=1 Tax=Aspergillus eucalypticola (strain CBS 122712 / IBT 29274) TaxID=1448314 RepID=A0A317UU44_ASPEC|nr:acetylglutamate kinase [Aspergillus eucalypticola CBS 122712]PWY65554.1 acetylglutamate kinase [Aspergillus eucalypticola CBS 122712]
MQTAIMIGSLPSLHHNWFITTDLCSITYNPLSRILSTNDPIRTRELLMADFSYAVLSTLAVGSGDDPLCGNLGCSRRVSRHAASSATCETGWSLDRWLKNYRPALTQEIGDHDYHMLWMVVLLLADRYLVLQDSTLANVHQQFTYQYSFVSGWLQHWSTLDETYLLQAFTLLVTLDHNTLFDLICAHETRIIPHQSPGVQRGKQYGPAVFLRITFANHSCAPNVTHQVDDLLYSYFDMSDYVDPKARRNKTQALFIFTYYQVSSTRSTIAQILNHIDSQRTAAQYLSHFTTPQSPTQQPFAVIKVGGAILDTHLHTLASSLAFFSRMGLYPVIVHGAGPQLNKILEDAGVEPHFEEGIRVTDGKTLALARRLFLDENLRLVQALEEIGVEARPITAGVFQAEHLDQKRYGLVGRITKVEMAPIVSAMKASCLPILTSMAETRDGQVLNVNADLAASELARTLKPKKVVYLAEKGGLVHGVTGKRIERINLSEEFEDLMAQEWVKYGTRLKIRAVEELLRGLPGTSSVSIVHPVDLQREVFAASGAGTLIERGTKIYSTTSAEYRDEERLVHALARQGAGADEVRFCVNEMRRNRPLKMYFNDPSSLSPLAVVAFGSGGAPHLITFPNETMGAGAVADDMFVRITKDFPQLVWNVRDDDDRLEWFSARATGRFQHGGWVMLWYGLNQQEARQLILGFQDGYERDGVGLGTAEVQGLAAQA